MARLFYQRFDTVGDGSGDTNMAVDGSSSPVTFKIAPSTDKKLELARIIMYVQDTGSMDTGKWGNAITLTNGFNFKQRINNITTDILGFPIKTAGDMTSVCFDLSPQNFGTGDEFLTWRWTFTKAGDYLTIDGSNTDELQLVVNDDVSDLSEMYICAQGIY